MKESVSTSPRPYACCEHTCSERRFNSWTRCFGCRLVGRSLPHGPISVECPSAVKDQSISSQARRDATGGVRIAAHLEDAFGVPILLHEMTPALALGMGTPLQSRKGLERLTV